MQSYAKLQGLQARPIGYWLRLGGFFLIVSLLAAVSLPVLMGFLLVAGLVYSPCAAGGTTPADYGLPYEDVIVPARAGGSFKGYFVPGTNGAAVIVVPALNAGRDGRLREASLLAHQGYAIFTFESRRCAHMGGVSLGYQEVDEVADALAYVQSRPEVDSARIGVYGFSSAGATSLMAAARLPQLAAVAAEGGYGDFAEEVLPAGGGGNGLSGAFETLLRWSIVHSYPLLTGLDIDNLSPRDVIARIAPRPILLIYGSREISLAGGKQQQIAAGNNAELWIVPGAGHGNYLDVAPQEYEARLVRFFDESLQKRN